MTVNQEEYWLRSLNSPRGREAFSWLYCKYASKTLAFVDLLIHDKAQAKDITHDIYMKIWQMRELVSKVDSFSAYVFKMARNAAFNYLESVEIREKFARRQKMVCEEFRCDVDESVDIHDLYTSILRILGRMPERRRDVFTLSRFKGLSNKEISTLLDISLRTVETHISHALADIRRGLRLSVA